MAAWQRLSSGRTKRSPAGSRRQTRPGPRLALLPRCVLLQVWIMQLLAMQFRVLSPRRLLRYQVMSPKEMISEPEVLSRFHWPLLMGQLAMGSTPRWPSRCRWRMTMTLS